MKSGWLKKRLVRNLSHDESSGAVKAGLPPGSLVYIGHKQQAVSRSRVITYSEFEMEEIDLQQDASYEQYRSGDKKAWINFDGINNVEEVEKIGHAFGLHILLMEDIVNTEQRPKMEVHDDHIFLTLKMLKLIKSEDDTEIDQEQVSFLLGKTWLLSFQEEVGDVFEVVRKRLKEPTSVVRKQPIDYLFYRLVDNIVDNYYIIAEYIGDSIEILELDIMENASSDLRWKMQLLRKEIIQLRKAVIPLREAIGRLAKEENAFVHKSTTRYFHDVYEHIVQLNDFIDTQRDLISSLVDLYMSGVSFKMNQIMKVLTIISTIFIPLTFIAGIYGMNFENMPELGWKYGYFAALGIMVIIVIGMLFYFRKKEWL